MSGAVRNVTALFRAMHQVGVYEHEVLTRGKCGPRVGGVDGRAVDAPYAPSFVHSGWSGGGFMTWNQIDGYCTQILGRLREFWGVLTHRPLDVANGRRAQMLGLLQRKYDNGTHS